MKSKRKTRLMWGRIIVYLIASALLFAIICAIAAGYIFISAKLSSFSFPVNYTVYYGNEIYYELKGDDEIKIHKDQLTDTGFTLGQFGSKTVYVDFSALAEYCGFYVSGNRESLRFILPSVDKNDDTHFTVKADSREVDLNGTTIHLSAPAVIEEGVLYLPIDFVDLYIQGISVVEDEKNENVYYLLCSNHADFYLSSVEQKPSETVDRSVLIELD